MKQLKQFRIRRRVRYKENKQNCIKNILKFQNLRILDFKRTGFSTMVRLLHCDMDIIGSKHKYSLPICLCKVAYIYFPSKHANKAHAKSPSLYYEPKFGNRPKKKLSKQMTYLKHVKACSWMSSVTIVARVESRCGSGLKYGCMKAYTLETLQQGSA